MTHAAQSLRALQLLPNLARLPVIELHHHRAEAGLQGLASAGEEFVRGQTAKTAATAAQQEALVRVWLARASPLVSP